MNWTASDFQSGEFTLKRQGPPPQTGKMTVKKLTALIKAGYGQGHFQRYKPWLRVTKRDYSPNSNIGHLHDATLARAHHYRSRAERNTIQLAKWLGAVDIREAFPVWPWSHPHPGDGLPGFDKLPVHPGLLTVAQEANIDHGRFLGTDIPYVATIDVMATWRLTGDRYKLVAFENKPKEFTYAPDPLSRAKERLELTRRYCMQTNIKRVVLHGELFPRELCVNLDMLEPTLTIQEQKAVCDSSIYLDLIASLNDLGYQISPYEIVQSFINKTRFAPERLWSMLHLALWRQDVDHDLSLPLKTWRPLVRGGRLYRQTLLKNWLGSDQ